MGTLFFIPAGVIAFVLFVVTVAIAEAGFRLGLRSSSHDDQVQGAVGVVQNSVLGLMAFLLGLSFSFTAGRYDSRHDLEQKEANCLGTAYMRTALIDDAAGAAIRGLLPQYVEARLHILQGGLLEAEAYQVAKARVDGLQNKIWKLDADLFRANIRDMRTNLLTQSLNDAFDAGGDVEEARRHRVPEIIYYLLFLAVLSAGGFVGYCFGRTGRRVVPAWVLFSALTAVTIFVILDLDRPERGLIRNTHKPLILLRKDMS